MESGQGTDSWLTYVQSHPLLALAIVVALGAIAYWRPRATFKLIGLLLAVGAIGYVLSFLVDLTSTGIEAQHELMDGKKNKVE